MDHNGRANGTLLLLAAPAVGLFPEQRRTNRCSKEERSARGPEAGLRDPGRGGEFLLPHTQSHA